MKNLVKLLIVAVVFTMSTESFAQTFGIKAGLNLSNMLMKNDRDGILSEENKIYPGFHLGAAVEFPMIEKIWFETGLLLSTKGFKWHEKFTDSEAKAKLSLFYVDIPLTVKTYLNIGDGDAKIYGVIGPYLGMGIRGKMKIEETYMGDTETSEEVVEWGSDIETDYYKRLDIGLSAGTGVEINSIQIGMSYALGLENISTHTDYGTKFNNRVIGITLGYKFGGK